MNSVNIMGRLTNNPELRYTQGEEPTSVCRYTLAVNRIDGKTADFINIVAFGKRADFAAKYFQKGQLVGVSGRIRTGSYTDRNGVKRSSFDVIAESQDFGSSRQKEPEPAEPDFAPYDDNEEDLPF